MPPASTFFETITAAVNDVAENGYDADRLERWLRLLREAALRQMIPETEMVRHLRENLGAVYRRLVDGGAILTRHPDIGRFTLARVRPSLRRELDRRVLASADLIRLNRAEAVETTLRRFAGWVSSVPPGGTDIVDRRGTKTEIRKALGSLPFRERRVAVDQGHKFLANLSEILATDGGAVAGVWHQHHTVHPRATHRARNGKVYLVRGNWAQQSGLVKPGPAGYTDEITKPAEEPMCRCTYTWLHSLRSLPPDMLTAKGRAELERVAA